MSNSADKQKETLLQRGHLASKGVFCVAEPGFHKNFVPDFRFRHLESICSPEWGVGAGGRVPKSGVGTLRKTALLQAQESQNQLPTPRERTRGRSECGNRAVAWELGDQRLLLCDHRGHVNTLASPIK